ncbi:MAG: cyclodeaminase/cyclohydrolase family protein [Candidatus Limnocylindria bacterium]
MEERLNDLTVRALVERLATSDPVPGGGSAAAIAGAMSAALVHMVVELTIGRPAAEGHEVVLARIGATATHAQSELLNLAELDAHAYAAVVHARRLPRETERDREARNVQIAGTVREATRIPLTTARSASEVLDLAGELAPIGNANAISDVGVAALLAVTALRGAALNVAINLPYVSEDDPLRDEASTESDRLLANVDGREQAIRDVVAERLR